MSSKNPSATERGRVPPALPTFQKIVYVYARFDPYVGILYAMNADGSDQKVIYQAYAPPPMGGNYYRTDPALSPDARRIVFAQRYEDNYNAYEIYTQGLTGRTAVRLTTSASSSKSNRHPKWSPDGKRIAFASWSGSTWKINIMDADGTNLSPQTIPGSNRHPCWSPDGSSLAYAHVLAGDAHAIYVRLFADGGQGRWLTAGDYPTWSPDGSKIAFRGPGDQIYVINADGTNRVQLTHVRLTGDAYSDSRPAWSPDGRRIAFERRFSQVDPPYGQTNIFSIHAADGDNFQRSPGQLTNNAGYTGSPSWAEGRSVLDPPVVGRE